MNITMKIVYASLDFVILNVIALPFATIDPMLWAWYSLCIALAFVLRLGMEHKKHRLTWASLMYQSICTISWSFFTILIWNYMFPKGRDGFEIYLFLNSLFATFLVGQFEVIGKDGIKQWLRIKLSTFLATESVKAAPNQTPQEKEDES